MSQSLRMGILGAAPIAVKAVIQPVSRLPDVEATAVAARDESRARAYADQHGIPTVHPSYAALLADPTLDAVYVPLPNSLHAQWTIRALEAGKHVLCEKPLAANASEAAQMVQAARRSGLLLAEAFHYRYHPLAERLQEIVRGGELGDIRHVAVEFSIPFLPPGSIQFRYDLGGGAAMDVGCYAVNLLRHLAGEEPAVTAAQARLIRPQVDRWMRAQLAFPSGGTGEVTCALLSTRLLRLHARVQGSRGTLGVIFPFLPHHFNWITVRTPAGRRRERVTGDTSYVHQLAAFAHSVRTGAPILTHGADAVANQQVVDAIYRAAGLALRGAESAYADQA